MRRIRMALAVVVGLCVIRARADSTGAAASAKAELPTKVDAPEKDAPTTIIIWGGGKTAADAERELAQWTKEMPALKHMLTLPQGYPRVLESKDVPGLKPGFHLVALGFCQGKEIDFPLKALQGFRSTVYAKVVTALPEGAACPKMESWLQPAEVKRVRQAPYVLSMMSLIATGEGAENAPVPWMFRLFLRGKTSALVDWKDISPKGSNSGNCDIDMAVEKNVAIIGIACEEPGAGPTMEINRRELKYRIDAGKVVQGT